SGLRPGSMTAGRLALMHRISSAPRAAWKDIVREQAREFAAADAPEALARWDESGCYELGLREVLRLGAATAERYTMELDGARYAGMTGRYAESGIRRWPIAGRRRSETAHAPSLYSRIALG